MLGLDDESSDVHVKKRMEKTRKRECYIPGTRILEVLEAIMIYGQCTPK